MRFIAALTAVTAAAAFGGPKPETFAAFDRYLSIAEGQMAQRARAGQFLLLGRVKHSAIVVQEKKVRDNGRDIDIPDGQVQHWIGAMFLPGVKLDQARAAMQDYDGYKHDYRPDVIDSKLLARKGDTFDVFLRLYKKQILTVVYNTTYRIEYTYPAPNRLAIDSPAVRVREVKDASRPDDGEKEPGNDHGFLWRLNSFWRFEEADGGVYVECEAITLSRDVPFFLAGPVSAFIKRFPRDSMNSTLVNLRKSIQRRASGLKPGPELRVHSMWPGAGFMPE